MALIVHKYGGTSMGSVERIQNVAKRVAKWMRAGHQVVVLPSAMSGETNRLLGLAKDINPDANPRELDQIASTGEQVSSGLLALALLREGVDAVSYAGWQVTVFNRGQSGPAPEGVTVLTGDRRGSLAALSSGTWDAVIDTCGYLPGEVAAMAQHLRGRVGRYVFISSVSACARRWTGGTHSGPTAAGVRSTIRTPSALSLREFSGCT